MGTITVEEGVRIIAGLMILLSVALTRFVNPNWYWFTIFIGANLLQSAFTGICPAVWLLKKAGLPEASWPASTDEPDERRRR